MRTSTTAAAAAVAATTTTPEGCTALEWRKVWQAWLFIPRPDVKGRTYTLHTPLLSKSTLRPAAPPSLSTNPPETDIVISGQSFLSSRRDIKNPLLSRPSKRARYTTPLSLSLSLCFLLLSFLATFSRNTDAAYRITLDEKSRRMSTFSSLTKSFPNGAKAFLASRRHWQKKQVSSRPIDA